MIVLAMYRRNFEMLTEPVPDPIERGEARCEAWAAENLRGDEATCCCGNKFNIDEGETLSADPYAIPVCGECFEKACLERFGECP